MLTIPLTLILQFWLWPEMPFFNRTGIVFWVCMAVGVVVSLLTEPKPEAELTGLIWNCDSLQLPAEQRGLYRGLRRPFLWWVIVTAAVLYFYVRFP